MKGNGVVAAMARIYKGDLNKIVIKPPTNDSERLERLQKIEQILEMVIAVHRLHIVISDFKPGNILQDGRNIFLSDLAGLIREGDPYGTLTPFYFDPREGGIGAPADHKADLYAAGLTIFELLHGPFDPNLVQPTDFVRTHLNLDDPMDYAIKLLTLENKAERPPLTSILGIVREEIGRLEHKIGEHQVI